MSKVAKVENKVAKLDYTNLPAPSPATEILIDSLQAIDPDDLVFDRIKFKKTGFDTGADKMPKELTLQILAARKQNAYFEGNYDPRNPTPPLCASNDGKVPYTEEVMSEKCASCKFNKYGSAEQGRGKACRNFFLLIAKVDGNQTPMQLRVPPSSLKAFNKLYTDRIFAGEPVQAREVVVEHDISQDENEYQLMKFKNGKVLDAQVVADNQAIFNAIATALDVQKVSGEELHEDNSIPEQNVPQDSGAGTRDY